MPILHTVYNFDENGFVSVLARGDDLSAPRYTAIDPTFSTGRTGENLKFQQLYRPGYMAGSIPGSTKSRILPRTFAAADLALNATALTVRDASIFRTADVLSIIAPSARVNVASSTTGWAISDTITVTLDGQAIIYTIVAADIGGSLTATNQAVALKVAAAIKANPFFTSRVDTLVVAGTGTSFDIVLLASSSLRVLFSLSAAKVGANGTVTASGATFAPLTAIGTISAVNPLTNVLTISAAAISVPVRLPIGVATSLPDDLGMLSPNMPIDLLYRSSDNWALYTDATVYRSRLPYWDGQLAALFPEITLV